MHPTASIARCVVPLTRGYPRPPAGFDPGAVSKLQRGEDCAFPHPTGFLDAHPSIETARHDSTEKLGNWRNASSDHGGLEGAAASDVADVDRAESIDHGVEHRRGVFVEREVVRRVEEDAETGPSRPLYDIEKPRRRLREVVAFPGGAAHMVFVEH